MFWRRKQAPPPPVRYEGMGDELSVEGSLVQAAQAIDIAGMLAASHRDSARLLQVGECWTKLADFIVALGDHEDKKNEDNKSDFATGFQPSKENDARD